MNESSSHRLTFVWFTKWTSKGVATPVNSTYSSSIVLTRGRSGGSLRGYKQLIAQIRDATTAFSGNDYHILDVQPMDIFVEQNAPSGQRDTEALWGISPGEVPPDPSLIDDTEASNIARRKVLSQAMDARSAFQGGPFVAQLSSTIRGVLHPLRGLREGLTTFHAKAKKLKHKNSGASLTNALADTWLEFQYGWLPLSSDINGALTELKRMSQPRPISFRAMGVTTLQSNVNISSINENLNLSVGRRREVRSRALVIYRGAYKAMPPNGWDWTSWGLGTQDFLPSVWEAIPWSFAVDYFTNIGQIISSYSYLPSNIAWVCKTSRKESTATIRGTKLNPGNTYPLVAVMVGGLGVTSIASTKVSRGSVSLAELIPQFTVHVPGAGSLQWLNIAALAKLRVL